MRSFQIYTHLNNDTHANVSNATRDRLKKILEGRFASNISESLSQPMPPVNTTTLTAVDGGVYQAYSDNMSELTLLQAYLEKTNVTAGGDCNDPLTTLFNQSNCIDHNNIDPQQWDTKLILAACNTNTSMNISTNSMLAMVTAFCAANADSDDMPDSDYQTVFNVILILISLTMIGAAVYIGCNLLNPRNNRSWLEDRQRQHLDSARAMYEAVHEDDDDILVAPYQNPDIEADEDAGLYDPSSHEATASQRINTRLT